MKEKTIIAAIVIVLTFLVGYLAFQSTVIFRDMIFGSSANCESQDTSKKCVDRERQRRILLGREH